MVAWPARSLSSNGFIEPRLAGRWADTSSVVQIYWQIGRVLCQRSLSMREDLLFKFKRSGMTAETSAMAGGVICRGCGGEFTCKFYSTARSPSGTEK